VKDTIKWALIIIGTIQVLSWAHVLWHNIQHTMK